MQPIVKAFPDSLFIIVERDEIENGHSILEGRFKSFGNYDCWWSVEPPNIENLKRFPAHQQVIDQIRAIYRLIDLDLGLMGVDDEQVLHLSYESFCLNPGQAIESLALFFSRNGLTIPRRSQLPDVFPMRRQVRIDPVLYERMVNYSREGLKPNESR